ncbi:MAG: hypothetical protein IPK60_16850 [Sandaracinaceae bacterium]|nr:hypothetical protein [Sandaracinaceae bacterium]
MGTYAAPALAATLPAGCRPIPVALLASLLAPTASVFPSDDNATITPEAIAPGVGC